MYRAARLILWPISLRLIPAGNAPHISHIIKSQNSASLARQNTAWTVTTLVVIAIKNYLSALNVTIMQQWITKLWLAASNAIPLPTTTASQTHVTSVLIDSFTMRQVNSATFAISTIVTNVIRPEKIARPASLDFYLTLSPNNVLKVVQKITSIAWMKINVWLAQQDNISTQL